MDELELLAFLDESNKPVRDPATGKVANTGNRYVVAAAVVLRGEAEPIRNELRALRDRIGYDLHYSDLGRKKPHSSTDWPWRNRRLGRHHLSVRSGSACASTRSANASANPACRFPGPHVLERCHTNCGGDSSHRSSRIQDVGHA